MKTMPFKHLKISLSNRLILSIIVDISCCEVGNSIILFNNQFCFLGMFRGINKVIEERVETLPRKELEKIIWANARLNNRTG